MQGQPNLSESSSNAPMAKPKLSLKELTKSIFKCPSNCSKASNASAAFQGDREALRKKTFQYILSFHERMAKKRPLDEGVLLEPYNIRVMPPCEDCQFVGYDKLNEIIAEHQAAWKIAGNSVPVPVTDENPAAYDEALNKCCKACFGDSIAIPIRPYASAASESKGDEAGFGADHAENMDVDSTSKL